MDLSLRQQKILAAIVKDYSETAQPVGSKEVVDKYHLKFSSATIRSDMSVLEKHGYITQPHKSAGRIPTDKGYRFFVNELMRRFELSERERRLLKNELIKLKTAHEQMGRAISSLLSEISGQAAFALLPHQSSVSGLSKIVGEPELEETTAIKEVAEVFERIDEHSENLLNATASEVETFIGKESPIPVPKNLSVVVSKLKLPSGKSGLIGIVGPKRMAYAKNQSLLKYLSKLISGTAAIAIFIYF